MGDSEFWPSGPDESEVEIQGVSKRYHATGPPPSDPRAS